MRSCEPHVPCAKLCPTLATTWTIACQAFLSMGFPRQEYRSGFPFSSPGDLPHTGVKPGSPTKQADSLLSELPGKSILEYIYSIFVHSNFFVTGLFYLV